MLLRFEETGRTRQVAEFRADGWPICPCCNGDELAAIDAAASPSWIGEKPTPNDIDLCYLCGPVEVVEGIEKPSEEIAT